MLKEHALTYNLMYLAEAFFYYYYLWDFVVVGAYAIFQIQRYVISAFNNSLGEVVL